MSTNSTPATPPNATPLAARRASPVSPNDEARQQVAWQREMERAQMATWFKPPVAARLNSAEQSPRSASAVPSRHVVRGVESRMVASAGGGPPGIAALPSLSLEASLPVLGVSLLEASASASTVPAQALAGLRTTALAEAAPEARAMAEPQIRRAGGPVRAVNDTMPGGMAGARTEGAKESRSSAPASAEAQAPLRLHEEATPVGQAVWIAMRADDEALAAMLPRIVSDLQHDMQQTRGQRLYQVVCNGRLVWRDGSAMMADRTPTFSGGERRPITVFDSLQSKGA